RRPSDSRGGAAAHGAGGRAGGVAIDGSRRPSRGPPVGRGDALVTAGFGDANQRDLIGAPGALLVIISGPSGVGKDTIIDALKRRSRERDYRFVVTCTTRAPRPGEKDGVSYHFLNKRQFMALRDAGGLLEANEVHGHWYGTPRIEVARALADGHDVILKIDVQGAQVIKER